jgi:predicted ribosome quality control (RQC) complex YloA/Tae2 family protein
MAFDGMLLKYCVNELREEIVSGRISKIYQTSKNEILFNVRQNGTNKKLLISAHPMYARIHLTENNYDTPSEPPMFCMLLRKHLEGGIIVSIEQLKLERLIRIDVCSRDEIGEETKKHIYIEIMGKHSNIFIVDSKTRKILDCIKHVSSAQNRIRTLLPGITYELPPLSSKLDPFITTEDELISKIMFNEGLVHKQLVGIFEGFSTVTAKEICYRAGLVNKNTIFPAFISVIDEVTNKYKPTIYENDQKSDFHIFNLSHLNARSKFFKSISEMLDFYFYDKAERVRVKQISGDLQTKINNEIDKNNRKLSKLSSELEVAINSNKYQLYGELITANIYSIQPGDTELEALNYYETEECFLKIVLDPLKTPSENAQHYFKTYNKFKNSIPIIEEQIENTKAELEYLTLIQQQLKSSSPSDVEEIREELSEQGYIKGTNKKNKKKITKPNFETYYSNDSTEILVGKNNKQNDYLTNKLAKRDEFWLHTKDIPGSHVIVRNNNPSEKTLYEAAILAAYFSKGKNSSSVPVDFTQIKNVKKIKGSKPGFVTYDNNNTIYVTPSLEEILKISTKKQKS